MQTVLGLVLISMISFLPPEGAGDIEMSLQGKLEILKGKAVALVEAGKPVPLVSADADIAATLGDERISGRQVKLVGRSTKEGSFSVRQLYIIRANSLYRLVYFCATCNITTFAPGNCLCCQQPTIPIEVLPTDPRIYHQAVGELPPHD